MPHFPIIDISALKNGPKKTKENIARQIGDAAHEFGFGYLVGHGIKQSQFENLSVCAEKFFSLPEQTKSDYYIGNSLNHRGYVPVTEVGDYDDEVVRTYEAFDLGIESLQSGQNSSNYDKILVGPNQWPAVPGFKKGIANYLDAVEDIGSCLTWAFENYFGLDEGVFSGQMSYPMSQLRLLHYFSGEPTNHGSDMGAHTDYECFTMIYQKQAGLQVFGHDKIWHEVPPKPDALVMMIGDLLEVWTSGYFKSVMHRVITCGSERYSFPFFMATNHDTVINPILLPERLAEKVRKSNYEPIIAGEHLEAMLIRDFPYLRKRKDITKNKQAEKFINPFEKNK